MQKAEYWESALEKLDEACRMIEATRQDALDYDKDFLAESTVCAFCAQAEYLLDITRHRTSEMLNILEA